MPRPCLIDLYVPTDDAHEASAAVGMAGLDAGVLVVGDAGALAGLEITGPTPMHGAVAVSVEEGLAVLLLRSVEAADYATFGEIDTFADLLAAARQADGCAYLAGTTSDVAVARSQPPTAWRRRPGQIALRVWSSRLARDLAFEDARLSGRRHLGGTGPEGTLERVGRYATLFSIDPQNRSELITALNHGLGIGVERGGGSSGDSSGDGDGGDTSGATPKKKRRRRRRRRSREEGAPENGGGEDASAPAPDDPD
jgi:hypothetical protein